MATAPRKTTASSRKPRTAARTASRPSTHREPDAVEPEMTAAEAQEVEAEGHYVTAELCGEEVQIVPASAWRTSWNRLLQQGDFDAFAQKVFHPDDYDLYMELDPTITEFVEFTQDASIRAGESLGNSRGPAPSSRSTRRR
ncbi:hypothetical protein GCM10010317_076760 [Streptomyces mirabilis]|uniref:hypothetical protein n=1 Tax=Streptomyces mirabilis TaxID=68239 RepID=UPI00167E825A|nr:hypothetical protein [Streptomyces mirabilis]GHD70126.1 hypothetical protein GCM10010317_076760 [Streptomyces mirabilis]